MVLTRVDGPVRWLIFNRPDKHNALSLDMCIEAREVVEAFARHPAERVLVVAGAGGKAFVSGADIAEFDEKRGDAAASADYAARTNALFFAVRDVEKPTIAMIEGICFGGGVALASACDIRLCADDALFSVPAARLGVGYDAGYVKLLVDIIGPSRTKDMLYTARRYEADEALVMGLVNRVHPKADLEDAVKADAAPMAGNAPLTQRAAKVTVNDVLKPDHDPVRVQQVIDDCMNSEDFRNARRAFMAKEKPVFEGK